MLNLQKMREEAERCQAETRRLFQASNDIRALDYTGWTEENKQNSLNFAKELWREAISIEKYGEEYGIFNYMDGWFCAKD